MKRKFRKKSKPQNFKSN